MTPAKMFDGDLYVLVADAVQMAENAYKNGQTDEREACAMVCEENATDLSEGDWDSACINCADHIRARS